MAELAAGKDPPSRTGEDEELDPRVKEELDILNSTAEEINKLEIELDHARTKFRSLLGEATQRLNVLYKKLGRCINKTRPYYDLLKESKKAQGEAQRAVVKFHRANGIYRAAKETVALAEERLMSMGENGEKREFDAAWQEMLNHATMKFMDSEKDKTMSEQEHSKRASEVAEIQKKCKSLEKSMPRAIPRSRTYFELKDRLEYQLQQEKLNVEDLVRALQLAKTRYRTALAALEAISEEVHMKRRMATVLPPRTPGVGAENLSDTSDLPSINLDLSSDPGGDVISINSDDFDVISTDGSEGGDDSPRLEPRCISLPVSPLARDTGSSYFQRSRSKDKDGASAEGISATSPPQMDPLGIAHHCQRMTPQLLGNGRKYGMHMSTSTNGTSVQVTRSRHGSPDSRGAPDRSHHWDVLGADGADVTVARGVDVVATDINMGKGPQPAVVATIPPAESGYPATPPAFSSVPSAPTSTKEAHAVTESTAPTEEQRRESTAARDMQHTTESAAPTDAQQIIQSSEPTDTQNTTESSAPVCTQQTAVSSEPTDTQNTTESSAPVCTQHTTESSAPTSIHLTTESSTPTDTQNTIVSSASAGTQHITESTAPIDKQDATESTAPRNTQNITESSAPTDTQTKRAPINKILNYEVNCGTDSSMRTVQNGLELSLRENTLHQISTSNSAPLEEPITVTPTNGNNS